MSLSWNTPRQTCTELASAAFHIFFHFCLSVFLRTNVFIMPVSSSLPVPLLCSATTYVGNGTGGAEEPAVFCPPHDSRSVHTQYRTSVYSPRSSQDREAQVATWDGGQSAPRIRVYYRLVSYVQRKTVESKGEYHTGWFYHFIAK